MKAMTDGLPDWLEYADTVASLAVDIGLAIGDAGSVMEGAAEGMLAAESDILGRVRRWVLIQFGHPRPSIHT
jgi:hypothetical protein